MAVDRWAPLSNHECFQSRLVLFCRWRQLLGLIPRWLSGEKSQQRSIWLNYVHIFLRLLLLLLSCRNTGWITLLPSKLILQLPLIPDGPDGPRAREWIPQPSFVCPPAHLAYLCCKSCLCHHDLDATIACQNRLLANIIWTFKPYSWHCHLWQG